MCAILTQELEEITAENTKIEHDVAVLKSKLQNEKQMTQEPVNVSYFPYPEKKSWIWKITYAEEKLIRYSQNFARFLIQILY